MGRPPPFAERRNADIRLMPFTVAYKKEYSRYHVYSKARYALCRVRLRQRLGPVENAFPRLRRKRLFAVALHRKCSA